MNHWLLVTLVGGLLMLVLMKAGDRISTPLAVLLACLGSAAGVAFLVLVVWTIFSSWPWRTDSMLEVVVFYGLPIAFILGLWVASRKRPA